MLGAARAVAARGWQPSALLSTTGGSEPGAGGAQSRGVWSWGCSELGCSELGVFGGSWGCSEPGCSELGVLGAGVLRAGGAQSWRCLEGAGDAWRRVCSELGMLRAGVLGAGVFGGSWGCSESGYSELEVLGAGGVQIRGARSQGCSEPGQRGDAGRVLQRWAVPGERRGRGRSVSGWAGAAPGLPLTRGRRASWAWLGWG